ncbi:YfiR family protein [Arsukibacterium perlucidum]|uniref:YfiR family protein n=1 Tax=Arsukibacterium perlucidum TaxID=368811 RepID=UPI0003603621|nr:YfiR family protein [Arsukibacterium perlucidum]
MSLLRTLKLAPVFAAVLSSVVLAAEQKLAVDEEKYAMLQAAYLFNIAKFISWPEHQQKQPFRLCLLGEHTSKLYPYFSKAFEKRPLGQRQIEVHPLAADSELPSCQLVYLTSDSPLPLLVIKPDILRVTAPGVAVTGSVLFDLSMEAGRIIIYHNQAAQAEFQLPINTALLRVTRPLPGGIP